MVAYRQSTRRRSILIVLVLTAVTFMTLDTRAGDGGATSVVRTGARDIVSPLQSGVHAVIAPVTDWMSGIVHAGSLRSENRKLRKQLEDVQGQATRGEVAEFENSRLKELLDLPSVTQFPTVAAHVVGGAVGSFEWTIQIDRGEDSGIQVGMPVVSGQGLVGRVVSTSGDRSTVLLITDPTSGVGARIVRPNVTGIAEGRTGRSTLAMTFVAGDADVKPGDVVTTSGMQNGRFPAGIPIGRIASAEKRTSGLDLDIEIEPMANLGKLEFVKVVKYAGGGK
ncbi:MAG: rod shape-determining protein MreC [Acidimicrobiia bacterium]